MTIEKYKKNQVDEMKELCEIISLQIESEDTNFILNLRKLSELLIWHIYDKNTNYSNISKSSKLRTEELLKNHNFDNVKEIYEKCFEYLSTFVHYQNIDNPKTINTDEIVNIIKLINKISISENIPTNININDNFKNKILSLSDRNVSIKKALVDEVLSNSYALPMYQRKYSWNIKNILELFYDILDGKYDLGLIYKSNINEIVDGQQRIHSMYILSCIVNKISNDEFVKLENFHIDRIRPTANWRGNFELFKNYLNDIESEQNELNLLYDEISKVLDEKIKLEIFKWNLKKAYFYVKIIKTEEGPYYFNKINEKGVKLLEYENIFSWAIYEFKNNDQDKILDLWVELDDKMRISNRDQFINNFLNFNKADIKKLTFDKFIFFHEKIAEIMNGNINEFLMIDNIGVIANDKLSHSVIFYQNLFLEIMLMWNEDFVHSKKLLIKNIFEEDSVVLDYESKNYIIKMISFIFKEFTIDKESFTFFKTNWAQIKPQIDSVVSVKEIDHKIFKLIEEGESVFFVEKNGFLNNVFSNNRNINNSGINLLPLKINYFITKIINSLISSDLKENLRAEEFKEKIFNIATDEIESSSFVNHINSNFFKNKSFILTNYNQILNNSNYDSNKKIELINLSLKHNIKNWFFNEINNYVLTPIPGILKNDHETISQIISQFVNSKEFELLLDETISKNNWIINSLNDLY